MIIDRRLKEEKDNIVKCREPYTFRVKNCNVWKDRPKLINFECVKVKNFRPSVHYLESMDAVMLVALSEIPSKIVCIFYETKNFYEKARILIKRHHFDCAMIVNRTPLQTES